jgi:hypothetical protein
MMSARDYRRIMEARSDISEFVLHCTRAHYHPQGGSKIHLSALEALKRILQDGSLNATHAWCQVSTGRRPAIRGPHPAVCFTDQPVRFFAQSIQASKDMQRDRYTEFGVAVRKVDLYRYGGRPVIYGDERILGERLSAQELRERGLREDLLLYRHGLPEQCQYLWAHYDPNRWDSQLGARPIDFTHEREWRACPRPEINQQIGLTEGSDMVVPLLLLAPQSSYVTEPTFVILVDTENQRRHLAEWIGEQSAAISLGSAYHRKYAQALRSAPKAGRILSIERVKNESSVPHHCCIEDFLTSTD